MNQPMVRRPSICCLAAAFALTFAEPSLALPPGASMLSKHPFEPTSVQPPQPPIPSGLTSTTDLQVCTQHGGFGGGLACKALLPTGALALVWNWSGGSNIGGFHVARVDGGLRDLVGTQPHNQSDPSVFTLYIVDAIPSDGFAGKCYAVSAYGAIYAPPISLSGESALSPEYCVSGNSVVHTSVFTQPQWFSVSKTTNVSTYTTEYQESPFLVSDSSTTTLINNGLVQNHGPAVGNLFSSALARTVVLFDVSSLANRQIRSARLRLTVDVTDVSVASGNSATNHYASCTDKLGTAMDSGWQGYHDWVDASIVSSSIAQQGPDVAFDVTSIVNGWTHCQENYGFVLFGQADTNAAETSPQDPDWTGITDDFAPSACLTVYRPDSIELEVQYQ
jgi:hypothetical protein